jgi:biopolymer transport protein ExbB
METFYTYSGNSVYVFQAILALVGAYSLVMVWRRVATTRFADEEDQDEFLTELEQSLASRNFDQAIELCDDDRRTLPQLALFAVENRALGYARLRGRVGERFQQDVMSDIEHRLSWVGTAIKTAPMLGLLGTVMGMMGAFAKLGGSENSRSDRYGDRHSVRVDHDGSWFSDRSAAHGGAGERQHQYPKNGRSDRAGIESTL